MLEEKQTPGFIEMTVTTTYTENPQIVEQNEEEANKQIGEKDGS